MGFAGRKADVGWSPNLHVQSPLLNQRDLVQCMKARKLWARELRGGRRRKEAAFLSFVCKADQTELAGVPGCCVISPAGLEAVQPESSLLLGAQFSVRPLLYWGAQRQLDPTVHLVHSPHYSPTSHQYENQKSAVRPTNG